MTLENTTLLNLPQFGIAGGLGNEFGAWIPRGARAIFVRSTGVQTGDDQTLAQKLLPTLAAGLAECRAGMGDTVFVLPGHTENVTDNTMLTNLVDGTRIIGLGDPDQDDAPTFRWTNTAGQWVLDNKNVMVGGLRLKLEGANGIVKAINITGAGNTLFRNTIQMASGASAKATIGIEVGSGATACKILGNYMFGTETHNVTDGVKLVGATVPSDFLMRDNDCVFSATAANGLVHVTVAALRMRIINNRLYNTHTSSSVALCFDNVASDGIITGNLCAVINTGTATSGTVGIKFGGSVLAKFFNNQVVNDVNASGLLSPTVDT